MHKHGHKSSISIIGGIEMYKMRDGLEQYLKSMGYVEEIKLTELTDEDKELLLEVVEDSIMDNSVNWEKVALSMQFGFKVFPTGWEKIFYELKSN